MKYHPLIGDWESEMWHAHGTQCLCVTLTKPGAESAWALRFYHPRRLPSGHVHWTPGMGPENTPIERQAASARELRRKAKLRYG